MNRIKYYVIHCTVEERDRGYENWDGFNTENEAVNRAKEISNDEFISVEKHHEIFERNDWLPNWDMEDKQFEHIDY